MTQIVELLGWLLDSGALIPGLALIFALYVAWILFSAKRTVPLTQEEIEMLWKFHKQKTKCKAKSVHEILSKKKIMGFKCECGYEFKQTRLITQEIYKTPLFQPKPTGYKEE